jgi:DNA-binding transcriptional regulator YiaG
MESWQPIPGYEKYEVSSMGNVRRGSRALAFNWHRGYARVFVRDRMRRVNVLVAAAFIGPRPPGLHAAHLNGVRSDNRAENIAYVTPAENEEHKKRHGTYDNRGSSLGAPQKLTAANVKFIREQTGFTAVELARHFKVRPATIREVRRRITWKSVA